MPDDADERIEGLEPKALFRAALGEAGDEADASEGAASARRAAEEERRVRAEIEARLPDLELFELLGRGGMGYVYRARQKKLDREVALKVVAPDAEREADFTARFAREARALARLNHRNIVAVYDYGQEGPFCWLVMEYVDGSNLRDVIRTGKLEPAEALALVPKICDALQYAHDHGVVHRDVKPENILLDGEEGVKIADFGLAKLSGTPAALVALTGTQQVLGTFRYMAPEQLDRPLEVDHRADIYSLGVVFYEMLTGEIPMGRFDPPSARSGAALELDGVVLRALEREPDRRYQHASEVKSDLAAVERRGPPPLPAPEKTPAASTAPKLSVVAVVSAAIFGVNAVPLMLIALALIAKLRQGSVDVSLRASLATVLILAVALLGLALLSGGSALGFRALREIRSAWPRLYGVGAAVVGAWAGPLFAANVAILGVNVALWEIPAQVPPQALGVSALLLLACDVAFLVWRRRQFLRELRSAPGS